MRSIEMFLCVILGAIFVISATSKLRHPKRFVFAVLEFRVLPSTLGSLYGWLLPPLELILGLFVLSGTMVHFATIIMTLVLASFIVAVIINIARGRDLDCNCFGPGIQHKIGGLLLLRDGLLLVFAATLVALTPAWAILEPWSVFRAFEIVSFGSLLALPVNLGLTLGVTALLWTSNFRERRYAQSKMNGKVSTRPDISQ